LSKISFHIRKGTPRDLPIVMRHRRQMFFDMGFTDENLLKKMERSAKPFFRNRLRNGTYKAWFIENGNGEVVAGGGIIIFDYHASPRDPTPKRPMIVNMYTEPKYRRKGLARMLMTTMIAWCREQKFGAIALHASKFGKPLYESLGFEQTNEMRLMLKRK